jgi:hypothetical protein
MKVDLCQSSIFTALWGVPNCPYGCYVENLLLLPPKYQQFPAKKNPRTFMQNIYIFMSEEHNPSRKLKREMF